MFSYEFCEISKNTFFTEHFWATAPNNSTAPNDIFYLKFEIACSEAYRERNFT